MAPSDRKDEARGESAILRHVFATLYVGSAIAATYYTLIRPYQLGQPLGLNESVADGTLSYPNDAISTFAVRQKYTGLDFVDVHFRKIVTTSIAGPGRLEERVWLQQFHFLVGLIPVLGILLIESRRSCWQHSFLLRYTWIWAILSRFLTVGVVQPLHLLSFIPARSSIKSNYLTADQSLEIHAASATLPVVMLGYVGPTVLMYVWEFNEISTMMGLMVYCFFAPILIDPLMALCEEAVTVPEAKGKTQRPEAELLWPLYANLAGVAAVAHLYTIYFLATATAPLALLSSAFVPSVSDALASTAAGTHNISLWNEIFSSIVTLLWSLQATLEVKITGLTKINTVLLILAVLLLTTFVGPGATIALIWWWRERKLVELVDRGLKQD